MSDTFVETPAEPAENRLSLVAAILLGIAATLTAFSAYNAALKDGDALAGYTDSNAGLSAATFLYSTALQEKAGDQAIFVQYATANTEGNSDLADYLYELMTPNLQAAVDYWNETDEAVTPFDDAESPYELTSLADGDTTIDEAGRAYDTGAEADQVGDKFELATVFLAMTLFFGGIATLFRRRRFTIVLLTFSAVTLLAGSAQLVNALGA